MQSLSSERKKLIKLMVYTISKLTEESPGTDRHKDMLAFIALTSEAVINSVTTTIRAWEKRGYWIKADQFREKWNWTYVFHESLIEVLQNEEWNNLSELICSIKKYTDEVNIPKYQSNKEPWTGSYNKLMY